MSGLSSLNLIAMICPKCKAEAPDGKKYCSDCGSLLSFSADAANAYIKQAVEEAIKNSYKDQKLVEVETTENIISKITGWAKLLTYFVGIPVAIFLFILSCLGYSSFSSFTKTIENTEHDLKPKLEAAKAKIDTLNKVVDSFKTNISQYKALNDRLNEISSVVNRIADSFNIQGIDGLKRIKIGNSLNYFSNYFRQIDANITGRKIEVSIDNGKVSDNPAWFSTNTIHVNSYYADDSDLFFREYTFRMLDDSQAAHSLWYRSIESALATYFPCSYKNNAEFAKLTGQLFKKGNKFTIVDLTLSDKLYFEDINATNAIGIGKGSVSNVLASTFWELRQTIGQITTDKLLFQSWRSLSTAEKSANTPDNFINKLLFFDDQLENGKNKNVIKRIFSERRLPL